MRRVNKHHIIGFLLALVIAFFVHQCTVEAKAPETLYELVDMEHKGYKSNPLIIKAAEATGKPVNGSYSSNVAFYKYLVGNVTEKVEVIKEVSKNIAYVSVNVVEAQIQKIDTPRVELDSLFRLILELKVKQLEETLTVKTDSLGNWKCSTDSLSQKIDSLERIYRTLKSKDQELYLDTTSINETNQIIDEVVDTLVSRGKFYYLNGQKFKLKDLPEHIVLPTPPNWKGKKKRNTVLIQKVDDNSHIGRSPRRIKKYSKPPSYRKKNRTTRPGKNCGSRKKFFLIRWIENAVCPAK